MLPTGQYAQAIKELQERRKAFNLAAQASGVYQVAEMKVVSGTEAFNNALAKQKVGLREAWGQRKLLVASMKEQVALQNALGSSFSNQTTGKSRMDLLVPAGNIENLRGMRQELGYYNQLLSSVAHQTVNWGKNTQWAGRQITVGVGMPIAMLGVGAAAAAYQVDKQMTRIQKVYDTANYDYMTQADAQIAKTKELNQLREDSTRNATVMAKEYGASIKDTLETQADLAQTGLTGQDLIKTTAEVTRIATLGELDRNDALQTAIALQNAFGLSADQMTEKFNFMNSVENATSLSIQDIAAATPRAASALAGLGVTVEEMTVLLVAMREKGVDAAEGANALKSATTRILNPTRAAIAEFDKYKIDVVKIVEDEGGNLFKVLQRLSTEMKDLDPLQRQQAIARLFGTYQFNRLNAALGGIGDAMAGVGDQTSQTARAMDVAKQSTTEWAQTADTEIQAIQDSLSGQFQIAVQTLYANLAQLGEPVLRAVVPIVNFISGLVDSFNALPEGVKTFALVAAGGAALAGVVLMLVGVVANLTGSVIKAGTGLAQLALRFKVLTPEQRAAEIAALRAKAAFDGETTSAERLAVTLGLLSRQMGGLPNGRHIAPIPGSVPEANTPLTGNYMQGRHAVVNQQAAEGAAETAGATGKIARALPGIVANAGLVALAFNTMSGSSSETFDNVTNILMTVGLLGALVPNAAWAKLVLVIKAAGAGAKLFALSSLASGKAMLANVRSAGALKNVVGGAARGAGGLLLSVGRLLGPLGIAVGIFTAIVAATKAIDNNLNEGRKNAELMGNAGEGISQVLEFTYNPAQVDEEGKPVNSVSLDEQRVKAMQETNDETKAWYDSIKAANGELEQTNLAIQFALATLAAGGSASDASNAVRTALYAAGFTGDTLDNMVLDVTARINFESEDAVLEARGEQMAEALRTGMEKVDNKGWMERMFGGDSQASNDAKEEGGKVGTMFNQAFGAAATDIERSKAATVLVESVATQSQPMFDRLQKQYSEEFKALGINSVQDLTEQMNKVKNSTSAQLEGVANIDDLRRVYEGAGDEVLQFDDVQKEIIRTIALGNDKTKESADEYENLNQVLKAIGVAPIVSLGEARARYNTHLRKNNEEYQKMDAAEKLQILNNFRMLAGLGQATSLQQGFSTATGGATQELEDQAEAMEEVAMTADDLTNTLKSAMSGTMSSIYEEADRLLQQSNTAQLDAMRANGEAELDKMKARADADADRYDAKRDAIQDTHAAEDEALNTRQEAETKRFNELWQRNADNAETAWETRIENEEAKYDAAIEKTTDTLNRQIEAQEAAYDARIKKIQDSIEAEERAEDRRQEIFEAERRRIERLAAMFNQTVDFNAALAGGNLDEAAKIQNDAAATQQQWSIDDQAAVSGDASTALREKMTGEVKKLEDQKSAATKLAEEQRDIRIKTMEAEKEARIKNLNLEQEAAMANLKKQQELEATRLKDRQQGDAKALKSRQDSNLKALENQKQNNALSHQNNQDKLKADLDASVKSKQAEFDNNSRMLAAQLETLKAATPRTREELADHIVKVQEAYERYGNGLKLQGDAWGAYVGTALETNVATAAAALQDEIDWKKIGQDIATEMGSAYNLSGDQLVEWLKTGNFPGGTNKGVDSTVTAVLKAYKDASAAGNREGGLHAYHIGGSPGFSQKDRTGVPRSSSLYPSETMAVIKKDEYVINSRASRKNRGLLNAINNGGQPMDLSGSDAMGGPDMGGMGAGFIAAAIGNSIAKSVARSVFASAAGRIAQIVGTMSAMDSGYSAAAAGKYGGTNFSATQLQNAATIMNVGRSMGASERDLIIGLMTAMQESGLNNLNYGDRDSVGLFQQRTSQGWGTIEQIMDPEYSAGKFFEGLLKVKGRNSMALTDAAQAVQRSGFPNAYAKWEDEAVAILNGSKLSILPETGTGAQSTVAAGGWNHPLGGRSNYKKLSSPFGMRQHPITGRMKLHNGMDFSANGGKPIYASKPGRVAQAGWAGSYGNYVLIDHGNNVKTGYAHMNSRPLVTAGQQVTGGQRIGYVGTTGSSTGNHLHYQLGLPEWVNPNKHIPGLRVGGDIKYDNTLANLHKNETVLTAPLSRGLKEGIGELQSGNMNNNYTFNLNFNDKVNDTIDIKRAVWSAIDEKDKKTGRKRVIK